MKKEQEKKERTDSFDEKRSIPASYSGFPGFNSLPGGSVVDFFKLFNHIPCWYLKLVHLPCHNVLVSTSNWTTSSAFLNYTVYLSFYHFALCRVVLLTA